MLFIYVPIRCFFALSVSGDAKGKRKKWQAVYAFSVEKAHILEYNKNNKKTCMKSWNVRGPFYF